jgi:hypothetical protein
MKSSSFYVYNGNIRFPAPPQHVYLRYIPYFDEVVTVWHVIETYSQLVIRGGGVERTIYGGRNGDGTMDYSWYSTPKGKYKEFLRRFRTSAHFIDSTDVHMAQWLRYEWRATGSSPRIQLDTMAAQTRIASSYGLLQTTYTTAVGAGYTTNNLPENLSLVDSSMTYAMKRQRTILTNRLGTFAFQSGNNWPLGFENSFYAYLYPKWNADQKYWVRVFVFARKFMPVH